MQHQKGLEELLMDIRQAAERFKVGQRTAVGAALDAGALLVEAKGRVQHGEWNVWVRNSAGLSPRTAQAWMKLSGLELSVDQIIDAGGIRAVLESKAKSRKSATVAHMPSAESLQRELAESESAVGQGKRAYYDALNRRKRALRAIARQARGDGR